MSTAVESAVTFPDLSPRLIEDPIYMLDPSELFRPEGKKEDDFRQYTMDKVRKELISR